MCPPRESDDLAVLLERPAALLIGARAEREQL
jgi:hypothetical protein